jgi:hypothetical protein
LGRDVKVVFKLLGKPKAKSIFSGGGTLEGSTGGKVGMKFTAGFGVASVCDKGQSDSGLSLNNSLLLASN